MAERRTPSERNTVMTERKMMFSPSLMCMDVLHMHDQLQVPGFPLRYLSCRYHGRQLCEELRLFHRFGQGNQAHGDQTDRHAPDGAAPRGVSGTSAPRPEADYISPHADTIVRDAFRTLDTIRDFGCKTGNRAQSIGVIGNDQTLYQTGWTRSRC